jgi:hypothetical protein
MSHFAHATPAISGVPGDLHSALNSFKKFAFTHLLSARAGSNATKVFLVSVLLCLSEIGVGAYFASQIVARAAVGCVCYLGFVQVLPHPLALSEASRLAVWDLIL